MKVKVWADELIIPTYEIEADDPHPAFARKIYPYTPLDRVSQVRKDKKYEAVFLENRYLRLIVLPQLGGRLYSIYDKTVDREALYRNRVIKPAMLAFRGAWITAGIEFNFSTSGAGHSVTTVSPVDYAIRENEDDSASVIVGDLEHINRMKWSVAITLYPDKAYVETEITLFNRTPVPHRYYFWSNAGIPATQGLQFIYPMIKTHEGWSFPIHNGKDLSWYKNTRNMSLFGKDVEEDFFGYYDHDLDFGCAHVANHHLVPGKKIFTWGTTPGGLRWAEILSDTDGPYCEIQSGRFETQGISEIFEPHAYERWQEYWFPIKGIGPFLYADAPGALSLNEKFSASGKHRIQLGVYTTAPVANGRIVLKSKGKEIYEKTANISPEKPFSDEVTTQSNAGEWSLTVFSATGEKLLEYTKKKREEQKEEIRSTEVSKSTEKTVEQLYLEGLGQEKNGNEEQAQQLYELVLQKDPGYGSAHCALGLLYLKRGLWAECEKEMRLALERDKNNQRARYFLGLVLKQKGEYQKAKKEFWQLYWSQEYGSLAAYSLGEMSLVEEDCQRSEIFFRKALSGNAEDLKAQVLLAISLRKQGKWAEAAALLEKAYHQDPIDYLTLNELYICYSAMKKTDAAEKIKIELQRILNKDTHTYLELATDYSNIGLYEETIVVLQKAVQSPKMQIKRYPLLYYYLGYHLEKIGKVEEAKENYKKANEADRDYVFPNRFEDFVILKRAIEVNPDDARARYYLGNLLFSRRRYKEAVAEWEESARLESDFSVVHRNLGWAFWKMERNLHLAASEYEKAIACNRLEPRLYRDLDQIYALLGWHDKRLQLFEHAPAQALEHSDTLTRQASLYVDVQKYDKALQLLNEKTFSAREGYYGVWDVYVDAHIGRGRKRLEAEDYAGALADFKAATQYPPNLGIGEPDTRVDAKPFYFMGLTYKAMGDAKRAKEYWHKAASEYHEGWSEVRYYEALSLQRLGRYSEATTLLDKMIGAADEQLHAGDSAHWCFIKGLSLKAKGHLKEAEEELVKALELNPTFRRCRWELQELQQQ